MHILVHGEVVNYNKNKHLKTNLESSKLLLKNTSMSFSTHTYVPFFVHEKIRHESRESVARTLAQWRAVVALGVVAAASISTVIG